MKRALVVLVLLSAIGLGVYAVRLRTCFSETFTNDAIATDSRVYVVISHVTYRQSPLLPWYLERLGPREDRHWFELWAVDASGCRMLATDPGTPPSIYQCEEDLVVWSDWVTGQGAGRQRVARVVGDTLVAADDARCLGRPIDFDFRREKYRLRGPDVALNWSPNETRSFIVGETPVTVSWTVTPTDQESITARWGDRTHVIWTGAIGWADCE